MPVMAIIFHFSKHTVVQSAWKKKKLMKEKTWTINKEYERKHTLNSIPNKIRALSRHVYLSFPLSSTWLLDIWYKWIVGCWISGRGGPVGATLLMPTSLSSPLTGVQASPGSIWDSSRGAGEKRSVWSTFPIPSDTSLGQGEQKTDNCMI